MRGNIARKAAVKRAAFIGRWQPWHLGHEWLIRQKSDQGVPVLVLVRDISPDPKNPFTTEQTVELIKTALSDLDVIVQVIPDIESVNWGRGVGYATNEFTPPSDVAVISATEIRRQVISGESEWRNKVNPKIQDKVADFLLDQRAHWGD